MLLWRTHLQSCENKWSPATAQERYSFGTQRLASSPCASHMPSIIHSTEIKLGGDGGLCLCVCVCVWGRAHVCRLQELTWPGVDLSFDDFFAGGISLLLCFLHCFAKPCWRLLVSAHLVSHPTSTNSSLFIVPFAVELILNRQMSCCGTFPFVGRIYLDSLSSC